MLLKEPTMDDPDEYQLLDQLDDVFLLLDKSGAVIWQNRAAREATGQSAAQLADVRFTELVSTTMKTRVREALDGLTGTCGTTFVAPLVTGQGQDRPYEWTLRRLPGGARGTYVAIGQERTTPGTVEDVLERMSDGFLAVDTNWRITVTNSTGAAVIAEAMGIDPDPDELVGLHLWENIADAEATTAYDKYHEAMATGETLSFETYPTVVEGWFDVRVYPSETGLSIYFYDITEERQHREELHNRERVLRKMYEITADRDRSLAEQVNALLALGRGELGTKYATLSKIDDSGYLFEFVDAADERIQPGDVVPVEATNCEIVASTEESLVLGDVARDAPEETHRAGYTEWGIACYIGAPVLVSDEVYGTFCFYDTEPRSDDFSTWERTLVDLMSRWASAALERRQATAELERQNERLERFANVLSHDLRNPLTVALNRLEMGQADDDPTHLEEVETALRRMESLIDDTLTLTRHGGPISDTEPVALEALARQCWEVMDTEEATLMIDSDLRFRAAPTHAQQLLENVIGNALRHAGPDITIRVGALSDGDGFYVADDGPGIPAEKRVEVFDVGYSTGEDGTGFGLSIVEEVATAHGWDVSVTESETGGARFEVRGVEEAL